jgi:hypothetical protein
MKSLKYLLVISLVALPLVASACWHPWTIYNNTSIFRLDNTKSEQQTSREANCRQWQQLTDCNIPLRDIEEVVYTMPIDEYEKFCAVDNYCGNNAFAQWIKRNDREIMEFLLLAKRNESIRFAYSSKWYYPTMKVGGPMTIEEIAEQAMAAKSERLRDRYLLQAVRALTTLGRYEECIELWDNEISLLPEDNLMRILCNRYIAGAYYHTGDVESAMLQFAAHGDFNSMHYIADKANMELSYNDIIEYCYRAGASIYKNSSVIRRMVVNAETWPVVKDVGDIPVVAEELLALRNLAIEASSNTNCAERAEWGYVAAYIYTQEGKYADAKRMLNKVQCAPSSEYMKESMEALSIYIDALSSTHDAAYEARLHKQMLWLEERLAKQISQSDMGDSYYWMGYGEYYWYNTIARIVSYTAAERYMKENNAVRALQLKNYVEYVGYKYQPIVYYWYYDASGYYSGYANIDSWRRYRNVFNTIDYSNNFFINFDMQTPDAAIAYVNRALNPITEFDRYLNDVGYTSSDFLYDVVGTLCLRHMRYEEAEYYFSLVSTEYERLLNVELRRDPFVALNSAKGTQLRDFRYLFASTMASLERSIETATDPNRRAKLLLKYGIGMANSVNNCWPLTHYGLSCDDKWMNEPITIELRNKGISCINEAMSMFTDAESAAQAHYALGHLQTVVMEYSDTEVAKSIRRTCDTYFDYVAPLYSRYY